MGKKTGGTGGIPTNFGYTTLKVGSMTYNITFLMQPDGSGLIQSPDALKGRTIKKVNGVWTLV